MTFCVKFSSQANTLKVYNYPSQIQPLLEKLPSWYKAKWSEKVMKYQEINGKEKFPSFEEFVNHVSHKAERTNIPQLSPITDHTVKQHGESSGRCPAPHITTLASYIHKDKSEDSSPDKSIQPPKLPTKPSTFCFYHKRSSHSLYDFGKFHKLSFRER